MDRQYGLAPDARFWTYVQKGPRCWEWTGYKNAKGYGVINLAGQRVLVHRYAYQLRAEIPEGLFVLHHCDNPTCVKFKHLFLGTHADNVADMDAKGRSNRQGAQGIKNHAAKLDETKVRAIRASSESGRVLGPKYGVSQVTIDAIRRRALWKHITDT